MMFALLFLAILGVYGVEAQDLVRLQRVVPASPLATDVITAVITVPGVCDHETATTVLGAEIRTEVLLGGCAGGPPAFNLDFGEPFGPLAPGTYTYRLFYRDEFATEWTLSAEVPIVVAAPVPAVPALSGPHLVLLALSLSLGAVMILRRVPA